MKRLLKISAIILAIVMLIGTVPVCGATDLYRIKADYLGEPDCPIGTSANDIDVTYYGGYYGGYKVVLIQFKDEKLPVEMSVQRVGELDFEFLSPMLAARFLAYQEYNYQDPFMSVSEAYDKGYISSKDVYDVALKHGVNTYSPEELEVQKDGIKWNFDPVSGTLTVSGIGKSKKMPDYTKGDSPALQWQYDIKHVVFNGGIYSIGDNAFSACTNIATVTFSPNIHRIGSHAFDDCTKIKEVTFSEGVKEIESHAFADLDKITFNGKPPVLADDLLKDFKGEIFYPSNNELWNDKVISGYNTDCTWIAFDAPEIKIVENIFDDLVPGHWYVSSIQSCYDKSIMEGTGNYRFEPNSPLTREQVAMMLYKYLEADETYISYSFTDVKAGAWYADAVEWMYQNGYTAGISEDKYGVGRYVTRQDLMTLVYNVIFREYDLAGNYYYKDTIKNFTDAGDISDYAFISMSFAAGLSWSSMCRGSGEGEIEPILYGNNGKIKPKDICTRAEAAAIFQRSFYADCFSPVSNWTHPTS